MIIHTFQEGNRTANICKQLSEWIVMYYEDDAYISSDTALNEEHAEELAEDYVLKFGEANGK